MKPVTRWTLIIVAVVAIAALATIAYFLWWQPKDTNPNPQGNPPIPNTNQTETSTETTRTFTSAKGVEIQIDNWPSDGIVTSPLTLTGKVPGSWSFEGEFPISVIYEGDIGLPGATAKLQGDWMTSDMVPFTATLAFDEKTMESDDVAVIFRNANPSGLPENDDSVIIKVQFAH